jgi:hypothetical protein
VRRPQHDDARPRPVIAGRALHEDTWAGTVITIADLGLAVDITGALASAVTDEAGVRRRPNGTYYRLRIGWVAYPQAVVVVRLEQALQRAEGGKLHTAGPYRVASTDSYTATSPATCRSGAVPSDPPASPASAAAGSAVGADQGLQHTRFQRGFETLAFLPSTVRSGVLARIRNASVFAGQTIRYDAGDRYELALLGLYPGGAVVVSATTHRDTTDWQTDQYVYAWAEDHEQLAAGARAAVRGA